MATSLKHHHHHHRISLIVSSTTCVIAVALTIIACGSSETPPASSPSGPTESCQPKVGSKAPSLPAKSAANAPPDLASRMKGKVTIVDFWATWCGPCEASFPKYQELYTKYRESGLEVIAVSGDEAVDKDKVPGWAKAHGAKFPIGWDENHKLAKCWDVDAMPTMFLVDKTGVVRYIHHKWEVGDEKEIEKQVKALL